MNKSERGFTFVEVLIALALLGIIGASFLTAINTSTQAVFMTDERATAESIARSQIEYVREQLYIDALPGDVATYGMVTDIQEGYSIWSFDRSDIMDNAVEGVLAVPWNSAGGTFSYYDNGLQRMKLVIKHYGRAVLTIETYKVYEGVY